MKTLNKAVARYNGISLIVRILIGLFIGAVLALVAPGAGWVGELGSLFVGALKGIAPRLLTGRFQLGIFLPQRGHLPFTGKQTGLIAQNFRTGRCQLSVHLLQLGTHRLGRLCRSLCRGRLGTALPRTIVLLPALRHGVPPIHPIRLIRL